MSNVEIRHDLSPSAATPYGASSGEIDDDWCSSPAEDVRKADLLAGRIAVDLPETASATIDEDDAAHSWMAQAVDRAVFGDGEAQVRREVDELVMAAVREGYDRALDSEAWLISTTLDELERRRAAGTGRVGSMKSFDPSLLAQEDSRNA